MLACLSLTACSGIWADARLYRRTGKQLERRDVASLLQDTEKDKNKIYKQKDRVLKYLDLGMLHHYNSDYVSSNRLLEQAEQAIDDLFTKSVSRAALSLLLNDNVLEYSGETHEDIYTNVFKALNYLHLNDFDAAFVEIRRVNVKLGLLEDKYGKLADGYNSSNVGNSGFRTGTNKFYNSALARFLSMLIYEQEGLLDDARIDYDKLQEAFETQPEIYDFNPPPLSHPLSQQVLPKLRVLSLIGRAPYKAARDFHIATTQNMLHVVSVDKTIQPFSLFWPDIDPDLYFKFTAPYIVYDESEIHRVVATIDGTDYELALLEDIGNVSVRTFEVKEPIVLLRNATRAVVKGLAARAAKKKIRAKNPDIAGNLMSLGVNLAVHFSEKADLRISRFFPNAVLVADIPLPAGKYNVKVNYYDVKGNLLFSDDKGQVDVTSEKLNLLQSWHLK